MADSVIIVHYNPDWPVQFEAERARLLVVFAQLDVVIEHVGSTAVPGLGAKPIIDIMVGVSRLADVEGRIPELEAHGYEYVPQYEEQLPERRYFRKPRSIPKYHLHCVVEQSDFWIRHLVFRDYLRAHPESAAAYFALKQTLAATHGKREYTEAKSPFIESILDVVETKRSSVRRSSD